MTPEETYAVWAPDDSRWSAWAKPVLFTALARVTPLAEMALPETLPWAPPAGRGAVVVDLPGAAAVLAGLALARQGYRPVPLFNGCLASAMIVDVMPLAAALLAGTEVLRGLSLPREAPPAFLLDSKRREGQCAVKPGLFDNRWAVVPQDMPSGTHLRAAGIEAVIVHCDRVAEDLTHILCRYQQAGLRLERVAEGATAAEPLAVSAPRRFHSLLYRFAVLARFRRNSAGGFGAVIPQPSSGGGYG